MEDRLGGRVEQEGAAQSQEAHWDHVPVRHLSAVRCDRRPREFLGSEGRTPQLARRAHGSALESSSRVEHVSESASACERVFPKSNVGARCQSQMLEHVAESNVGRRCQSQMSEHVAESNVGGGCQSQMSEDESKVVACSQSQMSEVCVMYLYMYICAFVCVT